MLKNARQFANKFKGGELPRESTTSEAEAKKTEFLSGYGSWNVRHGSRGYDADAEINRSLTNEIGKKILVTPWQRYLFLGDCGLDRQKHLFYRRLSASCGLYES